jgi:hypothetical protein
MGSMKEFGWSNSHGEADLRRDMVGIPKISGPQERERERCGVPRRNVFSTVPSGEPSSQGQI